jgi:hypothetical protein
MTDRDQDNRKPARPRGRWLAPLRRRLSRRQLLEAVAVSGLAGFVSSLAPAAPRREHPADLAAFLPRVREMRRTLQAHARKRVLDGGGHPLRRKDGFIFAVDVAQLLWYFAEAADREPYDALRDFAVKHLIVDIKEDPFTQGFVLWKCKGEPNEAPDASGTTEALRMAKALWTGSKTLGRREDAEMALKVLDGWGRHQNVDQGIWLIRNYFQFAKRMFATNSFIIDYDADFVREVAVALKGKDDARSAEYAKLADNSYGVLRSALAPCGLLYDLLQPELNTMYHGMSVAYFSPNDIIQTNNACATASTVAKGLPEVARSVLSFVRHKSDKKVHAHYYGRDGTAVRDVGVGATEYAGMARLAALLGNREATVHFTEIGLPYWERVASKPDPTDAWTTSEMLIAFQAVIESGVS